MNLADKKNHLETLDEIQQEYEESNVPGQKLLMTQIQDHNN